MAWKVGDKARIVKDDPVWLKDDFPSRIGQEVTILATTCGGYANLKVQNKIGDIFYSRPSWLRKPNQPSNKRETKSIKAQAAGLAEQRMKEIEGRLKMEQNVSKTQLPTFSAVSEKFYALCEFAKTTKENQLNDIVMHLAEKQLFNEIKDGVIWDGE